MNLHSEILEQPERLAALLKNQKQVVIKIARAIHKQNAQYVFLAARGASDNAGRYANYLWGAHDHKNYRNALTLFFKSCRIPPP